MLTSKGDFTEGLTQAMLAGVMLVGRLAAWTPEKGRRGEPVRGRSRRGREPAEDGIVWYGMV